jgi:hypothetical protein
MDEEMPKVLVVAPADLHEGFQFVATYDGGAFLVTGEHMLYIMWCDVQKIFKRPPSHAALFNFF